MTVWYQMIRWSEDGDCFELFTRGEQPDLTEMDCCVVSSNRSVRALALGGRDESSTQYVIISPKVFNTAAPRTAEMAVRQSVPFTKP